MSEEKDSYRRDILGVLCSAEFSAIGWVGRVVQVVGLFYFSRVRTQDMFDCS